MVVSKLASEEERVTKKGGKLKRRGLTRSQHQHSMLTLNLFCRILTPRAWPSGDLPVELLARSSSGRVIRRMAWVADIFADIVRQV